jgi:hypothetical protein
MSTLKHITRQNSPTVLFLTRHLSIATATAASKLHNRYNFEPPPSLSPSPQNPNEPPTKPHRNKPKPKYQPPSSLDRTGKKPIRSSLPFDFRFSYTESSQTVRPIGLREPKYSPFGPDRIDRKWTGVCAPAVDPKVKSLDGDEDPKLEEERKKKREHVQGDPLTNAERKAIVLQCERGKTKRQVNMGIKI